MYLVTDMTALEENDRHRTRLRMRRVHPRGMESLEADIYYLCYGLETSLHAP